MVLVRVDQGAEWVEIKVGKGRGFLWVQAGWQNMVLRGRCPVSISVSVSWEIVGNVLHQLISYELID